MVVRERNEEEKKICVQEPCCNLWHDIFGVLCVVFIFFAQRPTYYFRDCNTTAVCSYILVCVDLREILCLSSGWLCSCYYYCGWFRSRSYVVAILVRHCCVKSEGGCSFGLSKWHSRTGWYHCLQLWIILLSTYDVVSGDARRSLLLYPCPMGDEYQMPRNIHPYTGMQQSGLPSPGATNIYLFPLEMPHVGEEENTRRVGRKRNDRRGSRSGRARPSLDHYGAMPILRGSVYSTRQPVLTPATSPAASYK